MHQRSRPGRVTVARRVPAGPVADPWKELETIRHNNPRSYEVLYQQNEGDIVGGLLDPAWITGGQDSMGTPPPGARQGPRIWEIPSHLFGREVWSFMTVDPNPTECGGGSSGGCTTRMGTRWITKLKEPG